MDDNGGMFTFDAFSRAEIAVPFTLADYTFPYDLNPSLFDDISTGAGVVTHLPNESSFTLNSGTVSGDKAIFQSRRYHRYQAGKAGKIVLTSVVGAAQTNVVKRWGYFDDNNGLFFQQDADGTLSFNVRTYTSGTAVTTKYTQSTWNVNQMSGNDNVRGGFEIDLSKGNIFEIDFQWLGVGVITARIVDPSGRTFDLIKIRNPNANTAVYMTTATLPIRYEVENTGTAPVAGTLKGICSTVVSSGGEEPPEVEFGWGNTTKVTTVNAAETHVISYRPKLTFNSLTNRMVMLPKGFYFASDLGSCIFKLYLNSTLTTPSWTSVHAQSGMEYDVTGTIGALGQPLGCVPILNSAGGAGSVSRSAQGTVGLRQLALTTSADASTSDIITVTITRLTTTNVDAMACMAWGEVR